MFHSELFWRLFAWTSMATSVSGASSKTVWRHAIGWRHDSRTCSTMTSYFSRRFFLHFLAERVDLFCFYYVAMWATFAIVWMVPCQVSRYFIIQYITRQNHIYPTPTKNLDLLGVQILQKLHPAVFVRGSDRGVGLSPSRPLVSLLPSGAARVSSAKISSFPSLPFFLPSPSSRPLFSLTHPSPSSPPSRPLISLLPLTLSAPHLWVCACNMHTRV